MLRFCISEHVPAGIAAGATLGDRHLRILLEKLPKDLLTTTIVLVDFGGLEGVTASYLKAFLIPLLASSEADLNKPLRDAVRASVFVVNLNEDLTEDLHAALASVGKPCLEALELDEEEEVRRARVHGPVEEKIGRALRDLVQLGGGTAAELRKRDRSVGVTGWHYRLVQLHKLGLARRTKTKRSWKYEPIVTEVIRG